MSDLIHSQRVHIVNKKGLHARASAALAKLAGEYDSTVTIHHEQLSATANSIMDLMMLIAHRGAEIEIRGTGPDAPQAVTAIASLVASGFGELKDDLPG